VETPLQIGEISGSEADKYDWLVRITPVAGPPPKSRPRFKSQQETSDQPVLQLMAVHVRVSWGDRADQQRSVELNNLRLVQEPAS
jgi:general secretion pathway protein I